MFAFPPTKPSARMMVISGGQTGTDRAALDWAIEHAVPHGGWCPTGRLAEDGVIPARYALDEMVDGSYRQRTKANVRDSDATLIVSLASELSGGSLATARFAEMLLKPWLHVHPAGDWKAMLGSWISTRIKVLNVAGPRASKEPGVEDFTKEVLDDVLRLATARPSVQRYTPEGEVIEQEFVDAANRGVKPAANGAAAVRSGSMLNMKPESDRFELRIELRGPYQDSGDDPPSYLITQAVWINGENLAPDNPIDLRQLAKSCQMAGEFDIVTCGCGNAVCAEIEDGIRVSHLEDRIVWEVPEPLSYRGMPDEESEWHCNNRVYRRFSFDPAAYLAAVQAGLREAKRLLFGERQPVECSPYGFAPEDLLALDPVVFSARGVPIGCHIVGKHIAIDFDPGWVSIKGIHYRLRELPLPEAIRQLDDWSEWEPMRCGDGFSYGYAAAPDREVRRRLRLLGEHLAVITKRGGEIVIAFQKNWEKRRSQQLVLGGRA